VTMTLKTLRSKIRQFQAKPPITAAFEIALAK
jgi:hypothetical protein